MRNRVTEVTDRSLGGSNRSHVLKPRDVPFQFSNEPSQLFFFRPVPAPSLPLSQTFLPLPFIPWNSAPRADSPTLAHVWRPFFSRSSIERWSLCKNSIGCSLERSVEGSALVSSLLCTILSLSLVIDSLRKEEYRVVGPVSVPEPITVPRD